MAPVDWRPLLPALLVAITGLIVLLAQAFTPRGKSVPAVGLSVFGLAGALVTTLLVRQSGLPLPVTGGTIVADNYAIFFHVLILCAGLLAVLLSPGYLRATGSERGEHYTLMLWSIVGMLGLVSARELISLFVALEIMSVSAYALCGLRRDVAQSQEAALKYFVTGAFSSGFFLYGVALLYGASGSTHFDRIARALAMLPNNGSGTLAILGLGLLLVGFGFKVASVPFHAWAPDVYEGAPTPVTGFMAAGVKAAAFGAFIRVLMEALPALAHHWQPIVAILAVASMVLGNLGALAQSSLKRMLAYSSIAHAGYLLAALVAQPHRAAEAILFYLIGYAAVSLGSFGLLAALARDGREPLVLDDLAGLADQRPGLAAALTVFLISLTGIPVSAGFVGKFQLFSAAVSAGYVSVAIVGMLMSVVSAYYYLRVVVTMYMREPSQAQATWSAPGVAERFALLVAVVVVLGLGVYPGPFLAFARAAAESLGSATVCCGR
jgi:NADH-quinone oxidoreductase subunit N